MYLKAARSGNAKLCTRVGDRATQLDPATCGLFPGCWRFFEMSLGTLCEIFLQVFQIPRIFGSDLEDSLRFTDPDVADLHIFYGPGRVSF